MTAAYFIIPEHHRILFIKTSEINHEPATCHANNYFQNLDQEADTVNGVKCYICSGISGMSSDCSDPFGGSDSVPVEVCDQGCSKMKISGSFLGISATTGT